MILLHNLTAHIDRLHIHGNPRHYLGRVITKSRYYIDTEFHTDVTTIPSTI